MVMYWLLWSFCEKDSLLDFILIVLSLYPSSPNSIDNGVRKRTITFQNRSSCTRLEHLSLACCRFHSHYYWMLHVAYCMSFGSCCNWDRDCASDCVELHLGLLGALMHRITHCRTLWECGCCKDIGHWWQRGTKRTAGHPDSQQTGQTTEATRRRQLGVENSRGMPQNWAANWPQHQAMVICGQRSKTNGVNCCWRLFQLHFKNFHGISGWNKQGLEL